MFTDLSGWLEYIEQKNPDHIHLGLDHLRPIAETLNLIQWSIPVITIAGTNGKGSTLAALESCLLVAGKKVGSYTSPHLLYFNERIKINGQSINDEMLCDAFAVIEAVRNNQALTYFEWATLAALWIFKNASLDIILLEVGLGGRLDAVNLVNNNISIITGIDYDHQDWLGSDLETIAAEKAGIFKAGQIALSAQRQAPQAIKNRAMELHLRFLDRSQFGYEKQDNTWHWWGKTASGKALHYHHLPDHTVPFSNLAVAIQAMQFCLPEVTPLIIEQGLKHLIIPGRLQRLPAEKQVVLDVAHNPQSMAYLSRWLQQQSYKKLNLVMGVLADKEYAAMLKILLPYVDAWYIAELSSARALPAAQLENDLHAWGVKTVHCYPTVLSAYKQAYEASDVKDLLLVCGSFYAVTPVLAFFSQSVGRARYD